VDKKADITFGTSLTFNPEI